MTIQTFEKNGNITLVVEGKLSAATADAFGDTVSKTLERTSALTLDFKNVTYLASSGLRVLISAQKQLNARSGEMRILHVGEDIMEVFEITGLDEIFTIE